MKRTWFDMVAEDAELARWRHIKLDTFRSNACIHEPAEEVAEWIRNQQIPCKVITKSQVAIDPSYQHTNYFLTPNGVITTDDKINPTSFSVFENPNLEPVIAFVFPENQKVAFRHLDEEALFRAVPIELAETTEKDTTPLNQRLRAFRRTHKIRNDLKIALHELTPYSIGVFANFLQKMSIDWFIRYEPEPPIPHGLKLHSQWNYHLYIAEKDLIYAGPEGLERWWAAFVNTTAERETLYITYITKPDNIFRIWQYDNLPIEIRLAIAPVLMRSIKS